MLVTRRSGPVPPYLGVDLTAGASAMPRPSDVCGLAPAGGGFEATFWTWAWSRDGIESLVEELRAARCALIDGPQGLARPGHSMREADRLVAAAGKTPAARSELRGPYAGFVRSSIDLFHALASAGLPVSVPGFVGGIGEVYPGHAWRVLAAGLAKKTTARGLRQRRALLEHLGVRLALDPTHDQLDAALGALLAAAADGRVSGLGVVPRGLPLSRRANGELEEGPIAVPVVDAALAGHLRLLAREVAGAPEDPLASARAASRSRSGAAGQLPCPIPGCDHVFRGSRGGWDVHVASLRKHPAWHPQLREPEARKAAFRETFPAFFDR